MTKNERIFIFQIIPKDTVEWQSRYIEKIKANSYGEAQDIIDRMYVNKRVKCVYKGIDGGASNGIGR